MPRRKKAKANGVNKSEAIRGALSSLGSSARPRDVITLLSEKGVDVSPALVTNVIARTRSRKPGRKPGRGRAASRSTNGAENVSLAVLIEAKRLVDTAGSVDEAQRALAGLARLI